MKKQEQHKKTI